MRGPIKGPQTVLIFFVSALGHHHIVILIEMLLGCWVNSLNAKDANS